MTDKELVAFEGQQIRKVWHDDKWYFSVVDIVGALTGSANPQNYWKVLKHRLAKEGSQVVTNCNRLKMLASDGRMRATDVADVETMFRIIQSVPSPKAEPIKQWLARVGYERIQEYEDPSLAIDRAREYYKKLGRSDSWIQQRILGQDTRNRLTDYWNEHEITEKKEYAILTDIIHKEWSGLTVRAHKDLKNLKNQNLRDHMTNAELIFTALAELSTHETAELNNATGMKENTKAAKIGGRIARKAREDLERVTGKFVVSSSNFVESDKANKQLLRTKKQ